MAFDPDRYEGLAGFRYALRRFLANSEAISRASGITAQQYQALLALGCASVPQTMKDLAEQLMFQPHAAVQLVNRLQKLELVERQRSPKDGRSVLLRLTARGEEMLEGLADKHLAEMLKQEPMLSRSLGRLKQAAGLE